MSTNHPHASGLALAATGCAQTAEVLGHYVESGSGCRFVFARPSGHPKLWEAYLEGARESYRRFGVEHVLEYEQVRTGASTTLFVAAIDENEQVVAGVRAQGPYSSPKQAHALAEWGDQPGRDELQRLIASRLDDGLLELKAGWVSTETPARHALTPALARTAFHIFRLIGVRYALCTVADHAVRRWLSSGGEVSAEVAPVAYPDPRYRTVPIWWDRETMLAKSDASHLMLLAQEQEMFERSLTAAGASGALAAA